MIVDTSLPYTSKRLYRDMAKLAKKYPYINLETVGRSVMDKPIIEIRLGSGNRKFHFNGSFHANEWITSLILMKWLEDFLIAYKKCVKIGLFDAREVYCEMDLSIVPMVNPDGVDLVVEGPTEEWRETCLRMNEGSDDFSKWKANIRGVDLNNQFPANWDIEKARKLPKKPAPADFPGEEVLSEPEAVAMLELTRKRNFDRVLALHSQGKEFYWGYEDCHPKESQYLSEIFEGVSGYKSVEYVDSHAGFRDWFIFEFGKPGFTIELGEGVNPLPLSQFDEIYYDVRNLMCASILF